MSRSGPFGRLRTTISGTSKRTASSIRDLALAWRFNGTEQLPGGHCSDVLASDDLVLKLPFQGEEMTCGRLAAERLSGGAGPLVFRADPATGAVLMERVRPGTPLSDRQWDEALCREVFAALRDRLVGLDSAGMMPLTEFVDCAEMESREPEVFLHGDLHHENILLGAHGWVAIDPKGVRGDASFEAAAFLRNPLWLLQESPDLEAVTNDRLQWLSDRFGWNPWRMAKWTLLTLDETPTDPGWARLRGVLEAMLPGLE